MDDKKEFLLKELEDLSVRLGKLMVKVRTDPSELTEEECSQAIKLAAILNTNSDLLDGIDTDYLYNADKLKELNTYREVGLFLGVRRNAIYNYVKKGKLHPIKTKSGNVLFKKDDLLTFLNNTK